jgi:hypothetical protein
MKPLAFAFSLIFLLCFATSLDLRAQVAESATARQLTINTGAMASAFAPNAGSHPFYGPGTNFLTGPGTFVDVHFTHWIQLEGEARWLRFHEFKGEHLDNYLIGPKVPVFQFSHAQVYGKGLIGLGRMVFPDQVGHAYSTALAFGGGIDYKLSRKLTVRGDFEFQDWPKFVPNLMPSFHPFGISVGAAYRVF